MAYGFGNGDGDGYGDGDAPATGWWVKLPSSPI
jgi:hypothetical protein